MAVFLPDADCGLVAIGEAMMAGLPIVAARTPDIEECTGGEAALLVPAIPREATAAMLKIIDDPKLARRLGEAAATRARQLFDPTISKAQLNEIHRH
jgi:glycosyltransferase involved in cell wall biosynthesis